MFNVGVTYSILDWLNISARYRFDDSDIVSERKIYATTNTIFTEGSSKGRYDYTNFKGPSAVCRCDAQY